MFAVKELKLFNHDFLALAANESILLFYKFDLASFLLLYIILIFLPLRYYYIQLFFYIWS